MQRNNEQISEFKEKLVAVNRVSKTVKGGRNMRFSALMVVGDEKGRVGCGMGKAAEISDVGCGAQAVSARELQEDIEAFRPVQEIPMYEARVVLHKTRKDAFGIPMLTSEGGKHPLTAEQARIMSSAAEAVLKEAGAKRALRLAVGGAFHSPLMEPARVELAEAISRTDIKAPVCPVYQNVDAKPQTDPAVIRENLIAQLTAPVRWTHIVKNMLADGASEFTELGPGNVLQGLIKKVDAEAAVESRATL